MSADHADPWAWSPDQPAYARQPASLIRLEGEGSRRFLHGQTSAAIEAAQAGQWISTCCITPTARLRALAEVLVDAAGAWLAVTAGDGSAVHTALDRVLFPADGVRLGAPQAAWLLTAVAGEGEALPSAAPGCWQALPDAAGWQLGAGPLGQALLLAGDGDQHSPALPEAWASRRPLHGPEQERWRLRQGLPAAPGELNDEHNPFELGLAARVSLSKGCYVGQETLARLATYDGVKQQLRRWHWRSNAAQRPPAAGEPLGPLPTDADGADLPERLGRISSVLELANGDRIGLALVRRRGLAATRLRVGEGEGDSAAVVTPSVPAGFVAPPGQGS